ncbi:NYN domain-containing protein [Dechloromonas denitrificans]|uniref:NYN domain-containing protein n=1 Tax=Dechloromonas denitrificans TaxID=281362 RepID=UPI001CF8408C|nr:NYN domain-containing protein [Dechloromonas denitrificans]UCV10834.1 NYN domain-containing protein [Dechloromonas denitrificans]
MIALLIDADNLSSPEWVQEAVNILEQNEGTVAIRRAYGSAENMKGITEVLRMKAIRPFVNLHLSKNTTDISLAVDAMELACMTPRPKMIVIASGDLDFVPLVVRLRERGIRVCCISERSKLSQDAIPAYDQVIYVGAEKAPTSAPKVQGVVPTTEKISSAPPKKAIANTSQTKKVAPKVVAKSKDAPKKATKTAAASSKTAVKTHQAIIAALPKMHEGQWLELSEVAKILHDQKILAKNATSTKLFRQFPHHFELMPVGKPNKVRLIKP